MSDLQRLCQSLKLFLSDVDGVMTDGEIIFDSQGAESKHFHVRDGQGIKLWHAAGYGFGIVTGRKSNVVEQRAEELQIEIVRQGVECKLSVVRQIMHELGLHAHEIAYMGDDLPDVQAMEYVGLGITVQDAPTDVKQRAHLVTQLPGGRGAVREAIDAILKAQGRWESVVQAKFQIAFPHGSR